MQAVRWILLSILWTIAYGQDDDGINPEVQNYRYEYHVYDKNTGDDKTVAETKIGNTVRGQYSVGEPTGDRRVVKYLADEGGFRADVKYEEGGSPISEIQGRDTSAKTGYEFQWLPANPDDIEAAVKDDNEENSGAENASQESKTDESSEGESSAVDASTTSRQEMPSEETPSAESGGIASTMQDTSEPGTQSMESSSDETLSGENSSEKNTDQSEAPAFPDLTDENAKTEVSAETPGDFGAPSDLGETPTDSNEEAPSIRESGENNDENKSTMTSDEQVIPNSSSEEKDSETEQVPQSDESGTQSENQSVDESANQSQEPDSKPDESSGSDEENSVAASAPEPAATEPSYSYLPAIPPFQNLPFINFPMSMGSPQIESNSPTIIYASQNFYNPWQWLGMGSRRLSRDESSVEETNPVRGGAQYIPSLGYEYLFMPRPQQ